MAAKSTTQRKMQAKIPRVIIAGRKSDVEGHWKVDRLRPEFYETQS